MKIKQYNFIRGSSASGKSLFTHKLVSCLGNQTIYYNLDFSSVDIIQKKSKQFTISMQNPTFGKILKEIKDFNENLYEMYNIVIDSVTVLPANKDYFFLFVQELPKNHRYFFITKIHSNSIDDHSNIDIRNETLRYYSDSFLLPDNSISVFNTYKRENDILVYNYNVNKSYNLGDVSQIIRDIKIDELLSV